MKKIIYFLIGILLSTILVPLANADISTCSSFVKNVSEYTAGDRVSTGTIVAGPPTTNYWRPSSYSGLTTSGASKFVSSGSVVYFLVRSSEMYRCGSNGYAIVIWYSTQIPVVEPSHCQNQVKDGDEVGIDCGGSCEDSCDMIGCAENFSPDPITESCVPENSFSTPDKYGNCPTGSVMLPYSNNTTCVKSSYLASNGECQSPLVLDYLGNGVAVCNQPATLYNSNDAVPDISPVDESEPVTMTKGSLSIVETESFVETDNGDGTKTKVTSKDVQKTNPDNTVNNYTEVTTEIIDVSTNSVISSSTQITEDVSAEDNPENYNYGSPDLIPTDEEFDATLGEFQGQSYEFQYDQDSIDNNSALNAIKNSGITYSNIESTYDYSFMGRQMGYDFNKPEIVDALIKLGTLLVFSAYVTAFFIVFGGD